MSKFLLKIAVVVVAAFSFVGCEELHDIVYPLDRTVWVTENSGNNDYYIEFDLNKFTMYDNNSGDVYDWGTYDYDYEYPYDIVYLYGRYDNYVLEYDDYRDWLIDINTGFVYERGSYN